jgi:hypothetical protein
MRTEDAIGLPAARLNLAMISSEKPGSQDVYEPFFLA